MNFDFRHNPPNSLDLIVDLQIGDHLYRINKKLLAEKSDFFKLIFSTRTEETLKDIKIEERFMRCILKYIHANIVETDEIEGDYLGLYSAAFKLGFKDLTVYCEQMLLNTVNIRLIDV